MLGFGVSARFLLQGFILRGRNIAFYVIVIGLILGGCSLIYGSESVGALYPFLSARFIDEIGKAMLIAGALAGSVDLYLKRRLASDFLRDVAPYVEGIGLPQEFQDEIAFIRRILLYRKNLRLRYSIERLQEPLQDYVRLLTTVSFEIVNATAETQKHFVDVACEDAYPEIAKAVILAVGADDQDGEVFRYSRALNNLEPQIKRKGPMVGFKKEIPVRPRMGSTVFWADMETYEEESGSDIFYLSDPTVDITVSVEAPSDFDVEVFIGHRLQEETPPKIKQIPPAPDRTHTWQMTAAMLTWHSIYIRWKGKKRAVAKSTSRESLVGGDRPDQER